MRAFPLSMMAHSASTCQWSSRTPPAVRRISTPAMVVEIGSSRTVTWRVQPPPSTRLRARENEYLNGRTIPLSVEGGHAESGFSASRAVFCGPGSLSLGALCAAARCCCCGLASDRWARASAVAAVNAAEPIPNKCRLLTLVSCSSILASSICSFAKRCKFPMRTDRCSLFRG